MNSILSNSPESSVKTYYDGYWNEEHLELRASEARGQYGDLPDPVRRHMDKLIPRGALCLDLGCGDGQTSGIWLTENGRRYIGVDVSAVGVQTAQARGLDARLIHIDQPLPFAENTFDAVVCIEVLEHLFAPHEVAAEILRVLKPGAFLIATTPNTAHLRRRIELGLFGVWNPFGDALSVAEPWRDPHIRFFTPDTLRRMLRRVGFSQIEVHGHQGWIRHLQARGCAAHVAKYALPAGGRHFATALLAVRLHALARKPF